MLRLLTRLRSLALIIAAAVEFHQGVQFFKTSIGSIPSISFILSMGFGAANQMSISDLVHAGVIQFNQDLSSVTDV
jgi:hypothetical protein